MDPRDGARWPPEGTFPCPSRGDLNHLCHRGPLDSRPSRTIRWLRSRVQPLPIGACSQRVP